MDWQVVVLRIANEKTTTQGYPCGFYGSPPHECNCWQQKITQYMAKISGPLLDRIDIHIEVPAVKFKELSSEEAGEPSDVIRARVNKARERQLERFAGEKGVYCNAHMDRGNYATIAPSIASHSNCCAAPLQNWVYLRAPTTVS